MEKADSGQKLYTRMRLWEFPDQYVIEPTDGSHGSSLAVSRVDGSMQPHWYKLPDSNSVRVPKIRTIFGVVGILKLLAGTRMWRRGADSDGYVANFVETEQIMHLNGFTASFVQGSIPLFWEQIVDLTYASKFELVRLEESPRVAERHFLDLRKKYGAVLAVDLVNTHGGEGRLSEKFANAMQHIVSDDLRYWHFDFHHICGHAHFERLSILYEQIVDFSTGMGMYLLLNEKGEKMKEQLGVVRTNCIDCLDRTNVTQVVWANHGDDISIQYSGTAALKRDFVSLTMQGIAKDGINALLRYYFNNFVDGTKQDAIDLLQGHYIVSVSRDMTPSSQKGGLEAVALHLLRAKGVSSAIDPVYTSLGVDLGSECYG
ncbi:hypothetical protein GBA52_025359 [Prunus armeniaca]|nr:hypothetical protein GBA52_025359 [Prunus armeniaca]